MKTKLPPHPEMLLDETFALRYLQLPPTAKSRAWLRTEAHCFMTLKGRGIRYYRPAEIELMRDTLDIQTTA